MDKVREIRAQIETIERNAKNAGRDLTPDEVKTIHGKLDTIDGLIEEKRAKKRLAALDEPEPRMVPPWDGQEEPAFRAGRRGFDYDRVFGGPCRGDSGFRSFREFVDVVASRRSHPALRAVGSDFSSGGSLVPDEFGREIFNIAVEKSFFMQKATIYPMTTQARKIPAFSVGDHSQSISGVVGYWGAAGANLTESSLDTRGLTLNAHKLHCFVTAENEWTEDNVGGDEPVLLKFGEAWAFYSTRAFLSGNGAGQPLGILNAGCTIEVAKESGQAADTIIYENLTKMLSRLHPASFERAEWFVHPSTIPALLGLYIVVGTGGAPVPVLSQSGGRFTILTRPVTFTEHCSVLGEVGDIILADLSQYGIGMRKEMAMDKSEHLYFNADKTAYRLISRVDGLPLWNEALTLADGSTTVSPFVTLAAR